MQTKGVGVQNRTGPEAGIQAGLPEDFIRHPVSDSREKILEEQERLERSPAPFLENLLQAAGGKIPGKKIRWQGRPPRGRLWGSVKANSSKKAGVLKNQGVAGGVEDKVIVLGGKMGSGLGG